MLLTQSIWTQDVRGGAQWIYCWIDTYFCDPTGEYSGGIKMCKSGSWGRIGQVVCWHIDSLYRSDQTILD